LYRYYVSMDVIKQGADTCPVRRVTAGEIEAAVIGQVRALIRTPEIGVRAWRVARTENATISENDVLEALQRLDPVWDELFPASTRASSNSWSSAWMSGWTASTSGCGLTASPASSPTCAAGI
jgi:hypothetical protein